MNKMCKYFTPRRHRSGGIKISRIIGRIFISGLLGLLFLYGPVPCPSMEMSRDGANPGTKFSRFYSPEDYMLQPQNWGILQDRKGIIYVANSGGILEYDGVSWKSTVIPNRTARSLALDETGTIYVGGVNQLGYLSPNALGCIEYVSLLERLDKSEGAFGTVYATHAAADGIFFRTSRAIFRWQPLANRMTVALKAQKGEGRFNSSFTLGGRLYINQHQVGLKRLEKGNFEPIPGSRIFADVKKVFMISPLGNSGNRFLIGTREKGFFLLQGNKLVPMPTEADDYLKRKRASHGIQLKNSPGDIAIATYDGGLVVLNVEARLKYRLTKGMGLSDNNIKYLFEDRQGNLWAAMNSGIQKIEYLSPLSFFNEEHSHLPGLVMSACRHGALFYAGTTEGLYFMKPGSSRFTGTGNLRGMFFSLLSTGDSLLAAASTGVYQVTSDTVHPIAPGQSFALHQSRKDTNRVWVGMRNQLLSLYRSSKGKEPRWTIRQTFNKIDREIRTIAEDRDGNLWLGARGSGLLHIRFPETGNIKEYDVTRFDASHQLPKGEIQVFRAAGHVMLGTGEGLLRFDKDRRIFVKDETLGTNHGIDLRNIFRLVEDDGGDIWFHKQGRNYHAIRNPDQTYTITPESLARIPINAQVNAIYPSPLEGSVYFATHKGLIRCVPTVKKDYRTAYPAIIRKVSINGSPIYYNPVSSQPATTGTATPQLDYKNRNVRFDFAAPFFEDERKTMYHHILEGYDSTWSRWQKEPYKDYTNLDSGTYTFRVQARNVYDHLSDEEIKNALKAGVLSRTFTPVLCGSATKGIAIDLFMDFVNSCMPSPLEIAPRSGVNPADDSEVIREPDASAPFSGFVFKTIADPYAGRLSIFKVVSGTLGSEGTFYNATKETKERFNQLLTGLRFS